MWENRAINWDSADESSPPSRFFPFSTFRPYQAPVFELLRTKYRLMLNAPTGFGKTILALAAGLEWLQSGPRQLYLCAKTKMQLQDLYLGNLLKYESFRTSPADQLVLAPLIARGDLCSELSKEDDISSMGSPPCRGCRNGKRARNLPADEESQLCSLLQLGEYPSTFAGLRDRLAPYPPRSFAR